MQVQSCTTYEALPLTEDNRPTIESWGVEVFDDPLQSAWGSVYVYYAAMGTVVAILSPEDFKSQYEVIPEPDPDPE